VLHGYNRVAPSIAAGGRSPRRHGVQRAAASPARGSHRTPARSPAGGGVTGAQVVSRWRAVSRGQRRVRRAGRVALARGVQGAAACPARRSCRAGARCPGGSGVSGAQVVSRWRAVSRGQRRVRRAGRVALARGVQGAAACPARRSCRAGARCPGAAACPARRSCRAGARCPGGSGVSGAQVASRRGIVSILARIALRRRARGAARANHARSRDPRCGGHSIISSWESMSKGAALGCFSGVSGLFHVERQPRWAARGQLDPPGSAGVSGALLRTPITARPLAACRVRALPWHGQAGGSGRGAGGAAARRGRIRGACRRGRALQKM